MTDNVWALVADVLDPPHIDWWAEIGVELQPKQQTADEISRDVFELLYGGAAGGGKSFYLAAKAVRYAREHPGAHIGIVRQTLRRLKESHGLTLPAMVGDDVKHNGTDLTWTFPNGSIIRFIQLHKPGAEQSYKSAEFDLLLFDEVTEIPENQYTFMLSRVRSRRGHPTGVICTANPEGPGFRWVRRRWVRPDPDDLADGQAPPQPFEVWRPPKPDKPGEWARPRAFVPATIHDNPKLLEQDPDYLTTLESITDPRLRAALLEGDWDAMDQLPGALFSLSQIEADRVLPDEHGNWLPSGHQLVRTITMVDPAVTHGDGSDETGVVTVAKTASTNVAPGKAARRVDHGFVIADDTPRRCAPEVWARHAVLAAHRHQSDEIGVEIDNGGELNVTVIQAAQRELLAAGEISRQLPIRPIRAKTRGSKLARAKPVAQMYAQHRIHHVGVLARLEDQLTTWIPDVTPDSPDRLDAMVHGVLALGLAPIALPADAGNDRVRDPEGSRTALARRKQRWGVGAVV